MEILTHPNPVLKQTAAEVDPATDPDLHELVRRMARLMYEAPGVGLAAPQIGVQKRVIVYDIDDGLVALCNPRITVTSPDIIVEDEGCLSVPGISVAIGRSVQVTCEALDLEGNPVQIDGSDLLARVLQHEIDHLDGVLIIDRAAPEEKREAIRRYHEILSAL